MYCSEKYLKAARWSDHDLAESFLTAPHGHRLPQMSSFILIPGAGGNAWYWHRVVPLLEGAGHEAIAVDLPGDDERAGLNDQAAIVIRAIGPRDRLLKYDGKLGK